MLVRLHISLSAPLTPSIPAEAVPGLGDCEDTSLCTDERGRRYMVVVVPGTDLSWREIQQQSFIVVLAHSVRTRARRIFQQALDTGRKYRWITRCGGFHLANVTAVSTRSVKRATVLKP